MLIGILLFLFGLAVGGAAYRVGVVHYPGRPVRPYEQALVRRGGQVEKIDGPTWLKVWDTYTLLGIFDVSDRRLPLVVEPAYCMPGPNSDPALARQRFYAELMIVYRPIDMREVLRIGDDIEAWIESHVKAALRSLSLTRTWDLYDDGTEYADYVFDSLQPLALERGVLLLEVVVERLGVRTPNEILSRAEAGRARTLGRDGLVLQYLEVLKKMAESPSTTIILPTDLTGDPDAMLRAAKR